MNSKKRILFASARMTPPFFYGGAEKSNLTLALRLQHDLNTEVEFFGSYTRFYKDKDDQLTEYLRQLSLQKINFNFQEEILQYNYNGLRCVMTSKKSYLSLLEHHLRRNEYNAIITMLEYAPEIIDLCDALGVPVILWVMDAFHLGVKPLLKHAKLKHVIFTSVFLKTLLSERIGCSGTVFYPLFTRSWYETPGFARNKITLINPVPEKGGPLFFDIAKRMPSRSFLAVEGWRPVTCDMPSNVEYITRQQDMRKVFAQTRILLVPSTCQEAFGRVIIEAGFSAIPVIASHIGGIPEAVGAGGILINEVKDVDLWIKAILSLDDATTYDNFAEYARAHAAHFERDWCSEFLEIVP